MTFLIEAISATREDQSAGPAVARVWSASTRQRPSTLLASLHCLPMHLSLRVDHRTTMASGFKHRHDHCIRTANPRYLYPPSSMQIGRPSLHRRISKMSFQASQAAVPMSSRPGCGRSSSLHKHSSRPQSGMACLRRRPFTFTSVSKKKARYRIQLFSSWPHVTGTHSLSRAELSFISSTRSRPMPTLRRLVFSAYSR